MFNWLSDLFQRRSDSQKLQVQPPHVEAVAVHNQTIFNDSSIHPAQNRLYEESSIVYMAVNRIAEAAALVPMQVMQVQNEEKTAVINHPLEQLLNNPNPVMSRFELFEQTIGWLELTGNAYWLLIGDENGVPAQIWTLRPDRMRIVPDPQQYVRGYVYEIDGRRIPLEKVEVVHFKRWHPGNDYYGLSALEAARMSILSDRAMAQWNYNTFGKDSGVPAGIVNIREFVSDNDYERIKREWRNSYGGAQRKTAFLRGGSVEWQHIGLNHSELDFLQGRRAHRDEILNVFGIPVGLVSENATEANAKIAERMFIERTLYPKLVRLAQKITQELLPFYPGEHVALFDDIRPTDMQMRLEEIHAAQTVLSINEIRQRFYQLPDVTWGILPAGMPTPEATPAAPDDPETLADAIKVAEELAQWERFALNRLEKPGNRAFEVKTIPDDLAFEISAKLVTTEDKDAVKAVFEAVRE
ncbi:MAG: phage portal protein [Aggregatilineales bacterium]